MYMYVDFQTGVEFDRIYGERAVQGGYQYNFLAGMAYDAVWTLALALNTTARWVGEGWEPGGCEGERGSLVPLEEFSYDNAKMGCLLHRSLEQTSFTGVTVRPLMLFHSL